ncbi:MAG: YifB family Mg chelatase-like AAA ATPase [Rhodobacteraceae bacterium]|nr:YifB family Mg chelatase-like AAA ATPase [Paracoccaceae bacterium]
MIARSYTVAFMGVEAKTIEVQVSLASGIPAFNLVGLPDKAVSEAKERVRAAITAMGLALPAKRITINLSPADIPKIGSHFDLPIALTLLAAMDVLPREQLENQLSLGELSLDGTLVAVKGALPAAITAASAKCGLICPHSCGPEAAWVDAVQVLAPQNLLSIVNHFAGRNILEPATPGEVPIESSHRDLQDVRGQEKAKRALEIAAAGAHHFLMVGPPGSGKSMLAARLPGILPPLAPHEALETSMIHSLAGVLEEGGISRSRPFRTPHHTASMAAIVGGGRSANPGEISLAHNGALFLDELPEFSRTVLETLRQPLETGDVVVARANAHVRYPCRFMLVAAANPCKCGYLADPERACGRAPLCGDDYLGRISGPMMDRFDIRIDVPPVTIRDLSDLPKGEESKIVASRIVSARQIQNNRFQGVEGVITNSSADGKVLESIVNLSSEAVALLDQAAEKFHLSARAYFRVQRVARTIADLAHSEITEKPHLAEALSYRLVDTG